MNPRITTFSLTLSLLLPCLSITHTRAADAIATAPTNAADIRPLLIGTAVPALTLADAEGNAFDLNAAIAKQPTAIIFYRGGWCPYCNVHLGQLQTLDPELRKLGYQIIAVSPDRPAELAKSDETLDLSYTLLSDHAMQAALAFGIAFRVDDATIEKYKGYNIDLEAASGEIHHLLPVPSVFLVGTDGKIAFSHANPNYEVRLAPEVLLAAAKAALPSAK